MAGLAQGFAQGFQMMDGYYNRQDNQAYRQEQLGMQQERMDLARSANERAEQTHAMGLQGQAITNQWNAKRVNNYDNTVDQQNEIHGLNVEKTKLGIDAAKTQASNAAEDRKNKVAAERFQVYAATEDMASFATDPVFKGTNIEPLQNVKGIDAAIKGSEALKNRDFKTAIEQANILFKSKLNRNAGKIKGRDGGTIQNIDILDAVEQPDGRYKVPVWVATDGPNGGYNSFLSEQRGIDPDDPDKVFTGDDLFGTLTAAGALASMMKSSGIHDQMLENANRYLSPQGGKGSGVPAEVQSVAMLSKMTGIPAKDLVEAKYFSQKDPSGAMLQKMAIELAQKDSRLSGYGKNPGPEEMKKIIGEYRQMLSQPSEPSTPNADEGGLTESQRRLLEEAAIAIQGGKDRNAVIQRLVELGLPQDKINF
jgi:hypothetical protein